MIYVQINLKGYKGWSKEDLEDILDNESYRESEYIDYKENFAALECQDKRQRKEKQDEFRHDVCSLANADGGYLIFGIRETAGIPTEIAGIEIDNTDRFELNRRNELSGILPVVPNVGFAFVLVGANRYVVVIKIDRGVNKPYLYIENEGICKFFTRRGNRKQAISYMEIRNNFLQSRLLSEEIKMFRKERLEYYKNENPQKPIAVFHIIPEDFLNENQMELYDLIKEKNVNYHSFFNGLSMGHTVPNVDGVCFPDYGYEHGDFLQLYNNGVTELFYWIETRVRKEESWISVARLLEKMDELIEGTGKFYKRIEKHTPAYVCASIYGCKGLWSEDDFYCDYVGKVDRDEMYCMPIEIKDISDETAIDNMREKVHKTIKYALGTRK